MSEKLDEKMVSILKRSAKQQGYLLPIIRDQFGNIISGRHRKKADQKWPEQNIEVEDELDELLKIVHFNVQRRPSQKETANRLKEIGEILEASGIEKQNICSAICDLLPYSEQYIRRLLPDEYKHTEFESVTFQAKLFNVWNFSAIDKRFGTYGHPGQIPGQIVQNLLYYFSKENDLIVDPMAGGGTTIDVCKIMNRRCLAYDLIPSRHDIVQNDILTGYPKEAEGCDLIFLDPPYYNAMFKKTKFFKNLELFYNFIREVAKHSYDTVKSRGVVSLLMLSKDNKSGETLSLKCAQTFLNYNFTPIEQVSCPLTTDSADANEIEWAKENKRLLGRNRDLYVFQKNA